MFVPFKSQVYLPLVEARNVEGRRSSRRSTSTWSATAAHIDVDRMLANRLAQNQLMARLCAEAGIPFLDTTPVLAARVATGENVYFPDESHLNEAGELLIAEALAAFLRSSRPERTTASR